MTPCSPIFWGTPLVSREQQWEQDLLLQSPPYTTYLEIALTQDPID